MLFLDEKLINPFHLQNKLHRFLWHGLKNHPHLIIIEFQSLGFFFFLSHHTTNN